VVCVFFSYLDTASLLPFHTMHTLYSAVYELRNAIHLRLLSVDPQELWFTEYMKDIEANTAADGSNPTWTSTITRTDPLCQDYQWFIHIRLLAITTGHTIIILTMRKNNANSREMIKVYYPDPHHQSCFKGVLKRWELSQGGDLFSWTEFVVFWHRQSAYFKNNCLVIVYNGSNHFLGTTRTTDFS